MEEALSFQGKNFQCRSSDNNNTTANITLLINISLSMVKEISMKLLN